MTAKNHQVANKPLPVSQPNSNGNGKQPVGAVLVCGGGIAGIQASLDLSAAGFRVFLVEESQTIGGGMLVEAVPQRLKRNRPGIFDDLRARAEAFSSTGSVLTKPGL